MSENNEPLSNENETVNEPTESTGDDNKPDISVLVKQQVEENLKPIKEKLDSAYSARDEALKKLAEIEQQQKEAEKQRLKEQGKLQELAEMQLAEERAKREALEKRNVELTRDVTVKSQLANINFRNQKSREMAYGDIVKELIQDENGNWTHRSGASIEDYIQSYAENEDNKFLFQPKVSSGTGGNAPSSNQGTSGTPKSLFEMSQEEVLKLAAEGKLPRKT